MNGKVLITGGFGNLGSWITKYFATCDYEIFLLTRKENKIFPNIKYKVIECDITDLNILKEKLNFNIDFCIHMASFNEFFLPNYPKKSLEINTLGTRNLLEVLSTKDLKNFIYFSTFHVYGASSGIVTENSPLNPNNDYASTHLFAEYYIKQFQFKHNLKYTILRLTNSYGVPTFVNTDKWYLVLNDLVKSAYEKNKILLKSNGKSKRDFIFMGDVAFVVGALLKIDATNEVYNLSSSTSYEILELAILIKKEYEKRYNNTINIETNENDKSSYTDIIVKNDKLKSIINYETKNMLNEEVTKIFNLLEKNEK